MRPSRHQVTAGAGFPPSTRQTTVTRLPSCTRCGTVQCRAGQHLIRSGQLVHYFPRPVFHPNVDRRGCGAEYSGVMLGSLLSRIRASLCTAPPQYRWEAS